MTIQSLSSYSIPSNIHSSHLNTDKADDLDLFSLFLNKGYIDQDGRILIEGHSNLPNITAVQQEKMERALKEQFAPHGWKGDSSFKDGRAFVSMYDILSKLSEIEGFVEFRLVSSFVYHILGVDYLKSCLEEIDFPIEEIPEKSWDKLQEKLSVRPPDGDLQIICRTGENIVDLQHQIYAILAEKIGQSPAYVKNHCLASPVNEQIYPFSLITLNGGLRNGEDGIETVWDIVCIPQNARRERSATTGRGSIGIRLLRLDDQPKVFSTVNPLQSIFEVLLDIEVPLTPFDHTDYLRHISSLLKGRHHCNPTLEGEIRDTYISHDGLDFEKLASLVQSMIAKHHYGKFDAHLLFLFQLCLCLEQEIPGVGSRLWTSVKFDPEQVVHESHFTQKLLEAKQCDIPLPNLIYYVSCSAEQSDQVQSVLHQGETTYQLLIHGKPRDYYLLIRPFTYIESDAMNTYQKWVINSLVETIDQSRPFDLSIDYVLSYFADDLSRKGTRSSQQELIKRFVKTFTEIHSDIQPDEVEEVAQECAQQTFQPFSQQELYASTIDRFLKWIVKINQTELGYKIWTRESAYVSDTTIDHLFDALSNANHPNLTTFALQNIGRIDSIKICSCLIQHPLSLEEKQQLFTLFKRPVVYRQLIDRTNKENIDVWIDFLVSIGKCQSMLGFLETVLSPIEADDYLVQLIQKNSDNPLCFLGIGHAIYLSKFSFIQAQNHYDTEEIEESLKVLIGQYLKIPSKALVACEHLIHNEGLPFASTQELWKKALLLKNLPITAFSYLLENRALFDKDFNRQFEQSIRDKLDSSLNPFPWLEIAVDYGFDLEIYFSRLKTIMNERKRSLRFQAAHFVFTHHERFSSSIFESSSLILASLLLSTQFPKEQARAWTTQCIDFLIKNQRFLEAIQLYVQHLIEDPMLCLDQIVECLPLLLEEYPISIHSLSTWQHVFVQYVLERREENTTFETLFTDLINMHPSSKYVEHASMYYPHTVSNTLTRLPIDHLAHIMKQCAQHQVKMPDQIFQRLNNKIEKYFKNTPILSNDSYDLWNPINQYFRNHVDSCHHLSYQLTVFQKKHGLHISKEVFCSLSNEHKLFFCKNIPPSYMLNESEDLLRVYIDQATFYEALTLYKTHTHSTKYIDFFALLTQADTQTIDSHLELISEAFEAHYNKTTGFSTPQLRQLIDQIDSTYTLEILLRHVNSIKSLMDNLYKKSLSNPDIYHLIWKHLDESKYTNDTLINELLVHFGLTSLSDEDATQLIWTEARILTILNRSKELTKNTQLKELQKINKYFGDQLINYLPQIHECFKDLADAIENALGAQFVPALEYCQESDPDIMLFLLKITKNHIHTTENIAHFCNLALLEKEWVSLFLNDLNGRKHFIDYVGHLEQYVIDSLNAPSEKNVINRLYLLQEVFELTSESKYRPIKYLAPIYTFYSTSPSIRNMIQVYYKPVLSTKQLFNCFLLEGTEEIMKNLYLDGWEQEKPFIEQYIDMLNQHPDLTFQLINCHTWFEKRSDQDLLEFIDILTRHQPLNLMCSSIIASRFFTKFGKLKEIRHDLIYLDCIKNSSPCSSDELKESWALFTIWITDHINELREVESNHTAYFEKMLEAFQAQPNSQQETIDQIKAEIAKFKMHLQKPPATEKDELLQEAKRILKIINIMPQRDLAHSTIIPFFDNTFRDFDFSSTTSTDRRIMNYFFEICKKLDSQPFKILLLLTPPSFSIDAGALVFKKLKEDLASGRLRDEYTLQQAVAPQMLQNKDISQKPEERMDYIDIMFINIYEIYFTIIKKYVGDSSLLHDHKKLIEHMNDYTKWLGCNDNKDKLCAQLNCSLSDIEARYRTVFGMFNNDNPKINAIYGKFLESFWSRIGENHLT